LNMPREMCPPPRSADTCSGCCKNRRISWITK
jgi:hypothetical protein